MMTINVSNMIKPSEKRKEKEGPNETDLASSLIDKTDIQLKANQGQSFSNFNFMELP